MKFDSAYYNGNFQRDYTLTELENLKENNWQDFENIRNHLYCPECRRAGIKAVCDNPFYLSSKPVIKNNLPHTSKCSHRYEAVTSLQYNKYSENLPNATTINRRLKNLIRNAFFNEQINHTDFLLSVSKNNKNEIEEYDKQRPNASRSIPRKMITERFYDEDYNCYKMFYGEVLLDWKNDYKDKAEVVLLKLDKKYICSLTMSVSYIKNKIDVQFIKNRQVKIAFNSKIVWKHYITKEGEKKKIRNSHIENPLHIFFLD